MYWYFLLAISLLSPLLVFFDYRKRSNIHMAMLYVLVFVLSVFLFRKTNDTFKLVFAACVPVLMMVFLLIAKKRKASRNKNKTDERIIDDV